MTAVSRESEATRRVYTVERPVEAESIRPLLEPERAYSAYAIAQLDPRFFLRNEWLLARGTDGTQALVVHSRSGLGNALFAIGDPNALGVILSLHPGARFSFGSLRLEHRPVAEKYYVMTRPQLMMRMSVTRQTFQPVEGPAIRLGTAEVPQLNRLYSMEGGATAYRESHMEEGVYYGVIEGGILVSVAGTHVVSAAEGIAVVGNVFTHPRYRGQKLATLATSAVTESLLEYCDPVVLTVEVNNEPAVAVYKKLGYETVCNLHETPLIRKEPLGAISLVRRLAAGWRGRGEGKEVVER